MESAELADGFVAGAEEKMVSVGEDDFGIKITGELAGEDAFDGRLSADRHEHGGLNGSVRGVEDAGSGAGSRADGLEVEAEHRFQL